jgi:glycosyltransferase involved in cell wall biosynthesis
VPDKYKHLWINYFYFISKLSYQVVDHLITLFKKNQSIQLEIGADKEKSLIIPNCIDLIRVTYKPYEVREDEAFIIGAVLRVTPIKDVMTLIRSFKIVKQTFPQSKLLIIGPRDEDKEYYRQCLGLVELLELESSITFTGRVNVIEYYRKMDVLVLTSISEGQPLVILEAMAAGLPVVSTDVGACKELLQSDIPSKASGIITPLVNPKKTAEGIIRLLKNPKLAIKFTKNGRKRVEEEYYQDLFIEAYRELYKKNRWYYGGHWLSIEGII